MESTNAPAISVIIPMYNVENYIGECLDSLLMQTFTNFEIILVNDCSTDNSLKIAESYVEKFGGRLKIYTNPQNSGASATRNNGLMFSRGEYIYYIDSDDLLLLTGLEKMYEVAKKYDADVVNLSGFYKMNSDSKSIETVSSRIKRVLKNNEEVMIDSDLTWRLQKAIDYIFYSPPYLRFFRRDFFVKNKLFFPENVRRCEDVVWRHGFALLAKEIVHIPLILYFYRISTDSLSRKKRTPAEYINSRMTTIIDGIKWIDDVMNRVDFFKQNPQYRYLVLDKFMNDMFRRLLKQTQKRKWPAADVYDAVKQGFSEKLGKYDALVAELCSLADSQMKEISELEEQLKSN